MQLWRLSITKTDIFFAVVALLAFRFFGGCLVVHGQDVHPKVVLQYDHRELIGATDTDVVIVPADEVALLGLVPLDGQAALSGGDWMLCEGISLDVVIEAEGKKIPSHEIGFKCGGKRYIFTKLSINPKKEQ